MSFLLFPREPETLKGDYNCLGNLHVRLTSHDLIPLTSGPKNCEVAVATRVAE
jgi:hypothetical protein